MALRKNIKNLRGKAKKAAVKVARRAAKEVVKQAIKRGPKAVKRARSVSKAARKMAFKGAKTVGKVAVKAAVKGAKAVVRSATEASAGGVKAAGKAAARTAARAAFDGAKQVAKSAVGVVTEGAKSVAKTAMEGGASKHTETVKDPKDKAFEKGPGFHKQTWFRPPGVEEPGLAFVGYEIADNDVDFNQFLHYDQLYTIRHGQNSKFFRSLLKGKIVGTKCPKCGDAWVPPRTNCWNLDCNLQETDWVEFPLRAKVHTWTVAGWSGRSSLKKLPFILVYAKIEGSTVAIANYLQGIDPWDVEFDMPLKIVFVPEDKRVGAVQDFHFEPADGWKPGPMTPEKERIKKLVEPIYAWVKTLK
jgi:uncharacterized OB-fold protein